MTNGKAQSAFIMTAVGSLTDVTLRMAATDNNTDDTCSNDNSKDAATATTTADCSSNDNNNKRRGNPESTASLREATSLGIRTFHKHFEIVSLVGTFAVNDGGKHLHMSVSDSEGTVIGGHVISGRVFTTLELVLGTIQGVTFVREIDEQTGYLELTVRKEEKS